MTQSRRPSNYTNLPNEQALQSPFVRQFFQNLTKATQARETKVFCSKLQDLETPIEKGCGWLGQCWYVHPLMWCQFSFSKEQTAFTASLSTSYTYSRFFPFIDRSDFRSLLEYGGNCFWNCQSWLWPKPPLHSKKNQKTATFNLYHFLLLCHHNRNE